MYNWIWYVMIITAKLTHPAPHIAALLFLLRTQKSDLIERSWLIGKDSDAGRDWGQGGGEGDNRGWDGWMASLTRWTWVWVNSGSWWWTGRPGVLQFMGLQRVGCDWATELNWTDRCFLSMYVCVLALCRVQLFVTPWTVAHQALLSVRFSR